MSPMSGGAIESPKRRTLKKTATPKVSAAKILKLLAIRHGRDVFVPECKDGPTHAARHLRMDAWVMPRSWARPATTGYEIKVDRNDFLSDEKWQGYLPLCHQFYFVTPPGVAQLGEIPEEAGLIVTTTNATRLLTKKKAPLRVVEIPEDVWRYVLMARTRIVEPGHYERDAAQDWQDWLAERHDKHTLGYHVSQKIARLVGKRIRDTEIANARLQNEVSRLSDIREILTEIGIGSVDDWRIREIAEKAAFAQSREGLQMQTLDELQMAIQKLTDSSDLLRAVFGRIGATVPEREVKKSE